MRSVMFNKLGCEYRQYVLPSMFFVEDEWLACYHLTNYCESDESFYSKQGAVLQVKLSKWWTVSTAVIFEHCLLSFDFYEI